jgi:hypothetical protein
MVMSAPDPEVVELSSVRFPKLTPPAAPIVFDQKVMGPLAVLISLGVPLPPALPVIRPTDLTRIPWEPDVRLAFNAVVDADSRRRSVALEIAAPTVIAPVRDVKETPPAPEVVMVAEVVTVAQLTVRSEARLMAPGELVKTPVPAQVKFRLFVEVLVSSVETAMLPELSIEMFLAVMAETKSEAKMLVADAAFAWKTPSTNCPAVVPEPVIEIEVATNEGVIETVVPTNSSAVTRKVCVVVTPD